MWRTENTYCDSEGLLFFFKKSLNLKFWLNSSETKHSSSSYILFSCCICMPWTIWVLLLNTLRYKWILALEMCQSQEESLQWYPSVMTSISHLKILISVEQQYFSYFQLNFTSFCHVAHIKNMVWNRNEKMEIKTDQWS